MVSRATGFVSGLTLALALVPAAAQPPKNPPPAPDEQKAKEAFLAGKIDDALKSLQAAAKANPTMSPPKVVLARWCVETRHGPEARVFLEQAASEDPNHPEMFLTNASFALAEGRITDTILSCTAALAAVENPRWDEAARKRFRRDARLGLAAAYERRGDFASVKGQLTALLEADPKNPLLRQRLARANFLLGKPDEAFAELQTAVKDDPTLDPPEFTIAQLWAAKQDFGKADEWFGKAAAGHPNSAKVQRGFAGYLLDLGRLDAAKTHLAAAQKIEPDARDTKVLTGLFSFRGRDFPAAAKVFEDVVKDHPTDPLAVPCLALLLAETGDDNGKRRAIELAEAAARQNPTLANPRAVYAYCLFKAGRAADSEKVVQGLPQNSPLGQDGQYFVAKILADRGNPELAKKLLKFAVENKGAFVYRKEAEALLAELEKAAPPKK